MRDLSTLLGLCILTVFMWPADLPAQSTDPLATLDRTTLVEGAELTLRIRTRQTGDQLDLAPLLRDFEVISQAHSTNNPALTAATTDFLEWEIVLLPRRAGNLTVPSLAVGDQQTRPIPVRVLTLSPEQRAVTERRIDLDVDIASTQLYLGEPTVVTLTLFYNVNVKGTFADVAPDASEWTPLGDGTSGTARREDGRQYNYTRYRYLYTPLAAGPRELPAFRFEGSYRTHSLAPRQPLRNVASEPVALEVKPIPDGFPEGFAWLPAEAVRLSEQWSPEDRDLAVGDQVQRTLTLTVDGPAASALPGILGQNDLGAAVRTYPGRINTSAEFDDARRRSTRTETLSYLFMAGGDVELPDVRVPWWDLTTDTLRWAELPTRTVRVAAMPLEADLTGGESGLPTDPETRRTAFSGLALLASAGAGLVIMAGLYLARHRLARLPGIRLTLLRRLFRRIPARRARVHGRPGWLNEAGMAVANAQWPALLQVLADNLKAAGWPDTVAVESHWGMTGLQTLVKRTQALVYGAAPDTVDEAALATDWEALLRNWPPRPAKKNPDAKRPKNLYPD